MTKGRVLIVAGSDSGGGAGIQADIKTVMALKGYAATAVTALTAQDTVGVKGVLPVAPDFIAEQMRVVLEDIGADCVKTGMLYDSEVIEIVAKTLKSHARGVPLVLDPVMVAQSGDRLVAEEAVDVLRELLIPRALLITPNLPEAEVLLGRSIAGLSQLEAAARDLQALGCRAVLLKGGHLPGSDTVTDCLVTGTGTETVVKPRVRTTSIHGTGCTLASAIATGIANGLPLEPAVRRARSYLQRALETAQPLGHGNGPVNHGHTVASFGR